MTTAVAEVAVDPLAEARERAETTSARLQELRTKQDADATRVAAIDARRAEIASADGSARLDSERGLFGGRKRDRTLREFRDEDDALASEREELRRDMEARAVVIAEVQTEHDEARDALALLEAKPLADEFQERLSAFVETANALLEQGDELSELFPRLVRTRAALPTDLRDELPLFAPWPADTYSLVGAVLEWARADPNVATHVMPPIGDLVRVVGDARLRQPWWPPEVSAAISEPYVYKRG